uniref:hypothetical protein n=1 Tax=Micromonospora sp. WMMA1363 TaxID=3053985 RepID=UPI00259C6E4C|nr:hypothetical protein [Micromonospora sp. WMMA1363]MDM4721233.1 hypothetical protein [Micromonospora sp. WMMA1363]
MGKPDADDPGLPDLPPEWGRVVVPDDASALAGEAARIRRELRGSAHDATPRAVPPLAMPLLVLLVAVVTAVTGLVAVTWSRSSRPTPQSTPAPYAPPPGLTGRPVPALDLVDDGQPVPLRGLVPAVIVLVDGCACAQEMAGTAAVAPPGVTVITIDADPAVHVPPPPAGTTVRALADPADALRTFLRLPARAGIATALLVDASGTLVKVVPEVRSTDDYQPELARLAG